MKRIATIALSVLFIGVLAFLAWQMFFEARLLNKPSKDALWRMHASVQIGDSRQRVDEIYKQLKTDRITIKKDVFEDTWMVGMPFEFGASDLVLYIQFDREKTVSSVALRTADGIHTRPKGFPEDKGFLSKPNLMKNVTSR